jgi:hypothetical protein
MLVTEKDLLQEIRLLVSQRHMLLFHCRDSRGSVGNGFPDLVISGPRGTLFVELKNDTSSLTPDQRHWGSMLAKGGEQWMVWRPRDLQSGVIDVALDTIARHNQLTL